ncbi:hypothetical protein [Silvibacterium dinghuense]|uniref:DUF4412 domain-containing protein n=1 Tax=Silvibacterium dinghuense TaxID=1560006 RepID=A0A4Q1SIR6_9BACT|nr:hypothetical protein [Silvibacterium dinghuense]RXS97305.1 hypothetical protein ESZ00_05190 [Silvibacterium dinghuense]
MAVRRLLFVLLLLPTPGELRAQVQINQTLSAFGSGAAPAGPRQPYTAEIKMTRVQTLPDGTTITHVTHETLAIDSRSRSYTAVDTGLPGGLAITAYHVSDPAAGTTLTWSSDKKVVTLLHEPQQDQRHGCWATETGRIRWDFEGKVPPTPRATVLASAGAPQPREDLGIKTMDGVEATGVRFTRIIPAEADGNDKPLVIHTESWTAKNLNLPLKSVTEDPRSGTSTREVTNLKLGDPDPALFQPPADYEIKTEVLHPVSCPE